MPATSFHEPTGKWLTSFGPDAKEGDTHTISVGSQSPEGGRYDRATGPRSCEFTTFVLSAPVASDKYGPLFDLNTCPAFFPPTGVPARDRAMG